MNPWSMEHLRAPAANQDRKMRRVWHDPETWTNAQMLAFLLVAILISGVIR